MNNIDFVERFIAGTKEKQLQLSEFNGSMNGCLYDKRNDYDQAFSVTRGDSVILSTKKELFDEYDRSEGFSYSLIILTSNLKEVYRIDSDNLFDSDDGTTVYYSEDKKLVLSRLFRLAERSARKIDRLLDSLVQGLSDPADELPF